MRPVFIFLTALAASTSLAQAQTPPLAQSKAQFENVFLGEPMADAKQRLGDPVRVSTSGALQIWRYVEHGGATFVDVLVQNGVAYSVTVIRRFTDSPYTDPKGIAFGMTPDLVRAKLGPESHASTNADDGSLDLWYGEGEYAWIYEFYQNKLGFIQLIPSPKMRQSFTTAAAVAPNTGDSLDHAIVIRPSSLVSNSVWIDAFLAMNTCGEGGHWKQSSLKFAEDSATKDPLAYMIIHVRCTEGLAERDFYFDTHGMVSAGHPGGKPDTIYVDPSQLPPAPRPSQPPGGDN
jgi:hypothetical protein